MNWEKSHEKVKDRIQLKIAVCATNYFYYYLQIQIYASKVNCMLINNWHYNWFEVFKQPD